MADIDGILERLVTDQRFRAQLSSDPAGALAGYDLSADDLSLLASSMDEGDVGQRGVEQRTSKSAVIGLLASLTGGGGGGGRTGGGKAQAADIFAKTGGADQGNLVSPTGQGGSAQAADIFAKTGGSDQGNLIAPPGGGNEPSHAAVDMFTPGGGGGDPSHAAVDMFAPADISGNAPADVQGNFAPSEAHKLGDIKLAGIKAEGSGGPLDAPSLKIGPADDLSPNKVLGNTAPGAAPADLNGAPSVSETPSVSDTGGDGSKGILIGLDQGDAVNGDGSPAELVGLLQPPTGDSAKGLDVGNLKLGESVDAFLEIDDA